MTRAQQTDQLDKAAGLPYPVAVMIARRRMAQDGRTDGMRIAIYAILDGLSVAGARTATPAGDRTATPAGDSHNGRIAQIQTLWALERVLMQGGVKCLGTA